MHSEVVRSFESRVSNDRTVAWWMETRIHCTPFFLNPAPSLPHRLPSTHTQINAPHGSIFLASRFSSFSASRSTKVTPRPQHSLLRQFDPLRPRTRRWLMCRCGFHGAEWPTESTPSNFGSAMIYRTAFPRITRNEDYEDQGRAYEQSYDNSKPIAVPGFFLFSYSQEC